MPDRPGRPPATRRSSASCSATAAWANATSTAPRSKTSCSNAVSCVRPRSPGSSSSGSSCEGATSPAFASRSAAGRPNALERHHRECRGVRARRRDRDRRLAPPARRTDLDRVRRCRSRSRSRAPCRTTCAKLIAALNAHLLELTPPEFCSHLTVEQMADADTTVFIARDDGVAVACGALRRHDANVGEVKRMYTLPSHRGQPHRRRHPGADRGPGTGGRPDAARPRDRARSRRGLACLRTRRLHALRPGARLSAPRTTRSSTRSRSRRPSLSRRQARPKPVQARAGRTKGARGSMARHCSRSSSRRSGSSPST